MFNYNNSDKAVNKAVELMTKMKIRVLPFRCYPYFMERQHWSKSMKTTYATEDNRKSERILYFPPNR